LLFEFEEKVMGKATLEKNIIDLLNDSEGGITPEDKMRLFIIYYICQPNMSEVRYF